MPMNMLKFGLQISDSFLFFRHMFANKITLRIFELVPECEDNAWVYPRCLMPGTCFQNQNL